MHPEERRIRQGWLVEGFRGPTDDERIRSWKGAHPEFVEWTQDWFTVECAPDAVGDDSSPDGGGGSSLIFRSREAALKYGSRDEAIASGIRQIRPVYYADTSRFRQPEVARDEWRTRRREICLGLSLPGSGFFDSSDVLFAPATDEGAVALAAALKRMDELQVWAREQEKRLVEEGEGQ